MYCQSCGDETGANFCAACGAPTSAPSGGGKRRVDAAGLSVLVITLIAVGSLYASSMQPHLPGWFAITRPRTAPTMGVTTAVQVPTAAPAVPVPAPEPYAEVTSTSLRLSDYALHEVRLRLAVGRSPADVDTLLRSKAKSLRMPDTVVLLKLYPAGSDATSSDTALVTYIAADLAATSFGDPVLAQTTEIEPGLYRTPLPR